MQSIFVPINLFYETSREVESGLLGVHKPRCQLTFFAFVEALIH